VYERVSHVYERVSHVIGTGIARTLDRYHMYMRQVSPKYHPSRMGLSSSFCQFWECGSEAILLPWESGRVWVEGCSGMLAKLGDDGEILFLFA
jgi:hypothetical protein